MGSSFDLFVVGAWVGDVVSGDRGIAERWLAPRALGKMCGVGWRKVKSPVSDLDGP
jgi:hypothetical protein